jgi:hypothetical protein
LLYRTVTISGNLVTIQFNTKYTGSNNIVKLNANSVRDTDGVVYGSEITTGMFAAGPSLLMTSPQYVSAGAQVQFSTNTEGTVYLVPISTSGNQTDFENVVVDGFGKKSVVAAVYENQPLIIDTIGLAAGRYTLLAWGGEVEYVNIDVTPPLTVNQIFFDKRTVDANDVIVVSGLQEGDIVKVYNSDSPSATQLAPDTVVSSTYANISVPITFGSMYFFTVKGINKIESTIYGISAPPINDPPTAKVVPDLVINSPTTQVALNVSDLAQDIDNDPYK